MFFFHFYLSAVWHVHWIFHFYHCIISRDFYSFSKLLYLFSFHVLNFLFWAYEHVYVLYLIILISYIFLSLFLLFIFTPDFCLWCLYHLWFFFLIGLFFLELFGNALRLGLRVEVLGCAGLKLFFQIGIVFPFVMFLEYNHLGLELF